ncbi:RNA polymerase sigma factor [Pararcticibacter amylolyticus]|uniref:RNA polymerase sigma-70 factor n=1 Tax=Pararcticibacter amylolyticus TaxID=2173175 RepID=A0A2U2PJV1_9SPHI|nr:RNA polymerase sigma-70 factor [Pararcticibacter amylolyticus]PWG81544.1 hypothetical protein DDR33_06855 [Pararcticibacter amylolyticus]
MNAHHSEDIQLLERIKAGESQAFDLLFLKYYSNLMRFGKSLLPYPSDAAEDVVLEVFHKFWQNRKTIIVHTSLSALLYKAVKNHIYDHHRKYRSVLFAVIEDVHTELNTDYATPDQILNLKELSEELERLIKKLPEKMQVIFRMSREDSLTYQEIADILEISVNSVKTQMYRAIKFLKESYRFDNSPL